MIVGLSITLDRKKIKRNSRKWDIEIPIHEDEEERTSLISKLEGFVIHTIFCGKGIVLNSVLKKN